MKIYLSDCRQIGMLAAFLSTPDSEVIATRLAQESLKSVAAYHHLSLTEAAMDFAACTVEQYIEDAIEATSYNYADATPADILRTAKCWRQKSSCHTTFESSEAYRDYTKILERVTTLL